MPQSVFSMTFNIQGTLAANHTFNFKAPFDMQLIAAAASNSTANAGTLKIGTVADDDGYLAAENFGVSDAGIYKGAAADFDGAIAAGQFPHIAKDTQVLVTITDHASHMAAACVVLFFTPG